MISLYLDILNLLYVPVCRYGKKSSGAIHVSFCMHRRDRDFVARMDSPRLHFFHYGLTTAAANTVALLTLTMDTADDAPQDALSMPSLHDFRDTLQAVTQTPYPPRSLFIQASSNMSLLEEMLQACFSHSPRSSDASASSSSSQQAPPVQDLLPLAVIIDCSQVASTKSLYGRILNGLSGWGRGEWNDLLRGILNWDGRLKGYSIQQNQTTKQWYIHWDYANAAESLPSKTAFSSNPTKQGGIIDRKDESFSAFLEGLKMIFELGEDHQGKKEEEQEHENETTKAKFLTRPRFVVLLNAERLSEIESIPAGQNEGTLLASFMRLGELVSTQNHIRPMEFTIHVDSSSEQWYFAVRKANSAYSDFSK